MDPTNFALIELCFWMLVGISLVIGAFVQVLLPSIAKWVAEQNGLVDAQQSPAVRRCAVRLASRRRLERLRAVQLLNDLNDRSAVPALVRALRRYEKDAPFLLNVVETLAKLGDERALPALRSLTTGRNQALMQAAKKAVAAIEPRSTLVRSMESSISRATCLLRPAGRGADAVPQTLLRATGQAGGE